MTIAGIGKKAAAVFLSGVSIIIVCAALWPGVTAEAIVLDFGEQVSVGLVTPVLNNTGYRIWGNKYYPGDVLPLKMEEYMLKEMRGVPRVSVESVRGADSDSWTMDGSSTHDLILRLGLEDLQFRKNDSVGSNVRCDVAMRVYVYDAKSRRLLYDTVIERRSSRYYPFFNDLLQNNPVYWDTFEKSLGWPAIRSALDEALADAVSGYNGYRIVGRIVAKAERVDGSLTVPKSKQDKLYHINLGVEDSIRVGDMLSVTRASSVRTVAPETPEMHFPQVVARVRVIFVKGRDGVVEIVKESKDAPIQLGDAVSAPLFGRRGGSAKF
jgi:hypothetical protein